MASTEDEAAKIILIRSIEECDQGVFSDQVLAEAITAAKTEDAGLEWISKRASYLFERLSAWHQSILQLAKVPANWTLPVCLLAVLLGLATNLLGPTEKIHVVRNPVFFLVAWNILVYLGLLVLLLRNKVRVHSRLTGRFKSSAREGNNEPAQDSPRSAKIPWMVRYLMPRVWQFVHKIMFGFDQTRNLAKLTTVFSMHWLSVASPLVVARWRYLLHLGALCIAVGAVVGMYIRGLFQGYEFIWTSTFITSEESVSGFVKLLFGPSFFVSSLLNLGLSERIDVARLITPDGDKSDAWIHLFAISVLIAVVIPRGALALFQLKTIKKHVTGFGLALDKYYGDVIEAPIWSLIDKETRAAVTRFAENVASYVSLKLYDQQITPKLHDFREKGGRIADLKTELTMRSEAFSSEVKTYILNTAIPQFKDFLSQRVGEIVKNIGTDFVIARDPEAIFHDLKIDAPANPDLGVSNQISMAIAVSIGTTMSVAFGAVAGGIGEELGIAIVAALLGTTGPVGFVIGLIVGALVAAGAWWFGKDKITEAVDSVKLPPIAVRAALWESRFKKLIDDGRTKCVESVQAKVKEELTPIVPRITDDIMFRIRSLWKS